MRLLTFNDVYPSAPGPLIPTEPIFAKLNVLKVEDIYNHIKYQNLFLSVFIE